MTNWPGEELHPFRRRVLLTLHCCGFFQLFRSDAIAILEPSDGPLTLTLPLFPGLVPSPARCRRNELTDDVLMTQQTVVGTSSHPDLRSDRITFLRASATCHKADSFVRC